MNNMRNTRRLVPHGEDRRQKFERLLINRMNRALDSIRLIGNLASPNYRYSTRDMQLIRSALADAVSDMMRKFEPPKLERHSFTLPVDLEKPVLSKAAKTPKIHVVKHGNGIAAE